jgi:anthranilate/para-aminobenzoate synthase component II
MAIRHKAMEVRWLRYHPGTNSLRLIKFFWGCVKYAQSAEKYFVQVGAMTAQPSPSSIRDHSGVKMAIRHKGVEVIAIIYHTEWR